MSKNRDKIPVFSYYGEKEEIKMTGEELVAFAKSKLGVPYVYGMKGEVMTLAKYNQLKSMYGALVWDSDKNKVGKVCCDCSGLISWATGIIRNSQGYHDTALEVQPISTISKAPIGAAVWQKGHIGIYIGCLLYTSPSPRDRG